MKKRHETNSDNLLWLAITEGWNEKGVIGEATSSSKNKGILKSKDFPNPKPPFAKGDKGGLLLLILILLFSSCKFTYEDDKLSQMATAFNLAKPLAEAEARIVIQCDADTPTGVKSLRGTVMDYDSGSPIQNAFASSQVSTEVYVTDTEGKFKIQKVGIETDTVILKVFADNYKSLSHPVQFICQNISALIYLPILPPTPVFVPDLAPSGACIFGTSNYGGCKL